MKRQPREALEQLDERERRLFEMKRGHAPSRHTEMMFRWVAILLGVAALAWAIHFLIHQ